MNRPLFTNSFLEKDIFKGKKVLIEIFHSKYGNVIHTIESTNVTVEEANIALVGGSEASYHFLPNQWDIAIREEENLMNSSPDEWEKVFDPDMRRYHQQRRMEKIDISEIDFKELYKDSFLGKLYSNIRDSVFRSKYSLMNYFCCIVVSLNKVEAGLENKDEILTDETSKIISENKTILGKLSKEIQEEIVEIPIAHYEEVISVFKDINLVRIT